jgi:nucleoside-diphosphate-sugar epimerase
MRVLVTGTRGRVGPAVVAGLRSAGHHVAELDARLGHDIRNPRSVRAAMEGHGAVVHLASVSHRAPWPSALATNGWGTRAVLAAARHHGISRLVHVSSLQATGLFMGHRAPDAVPIDDHHRCRPRTPYEVTKWLAERDAARIAARTPGARWVTLRIPAVWDDDRLRQSWVRWQDDEARQWSPFWEYGAFLHVDDLATLVARAVAAEPAVLAEPHLVLTAAAADVAATWTVADLLARLHPDVPWRHDDDRRASEADPYRSLIDSSRAEAVLGWRAQRRFRPRPGSTDDGPGAG